MATQYNIYKYLEGINGFGLYACDTNYTATLVASTDTSFTVPGVSSLGTPTATTNNKFVAIFSWTDSDDLFLNLNATAALPVGGTLAASTTAMLDRGNAARIVKAGDVIHLISSSTPKVCVSLYAIQE